MEQDCEAPPKSPPGCRAILTFTGSAGEQNDVTVRPRDAAGRGVIEDAGAPITAGSGCESTAPGRVACTYDEALVELGDQADRVLLGDPASGAHTIAVDGGDGDDTLTGANDNDHLRGGAGADVLNGAGLDDRLEGGAGPDVLNGGSGVDTVDYSARTAPLTVDLHRGATSGEAGEGDQLQRVEAVVGGSGDDVLTGSGQRDSLYGEFGDDRLLGLANEDRLRGGPGDDALDGGSNRDSLELFEIPGGVRDRVHCGSARDLVLDQRRQDLLEPDCERIAARDHEVLTIPAQPLRLTPSAIVYRVPCSGSIGGCAGRLEISRPGVVRPLGSAEYRHPNNEVDRYLRLAVPVGDTARLHGEILEVRLGDRAEELCAPCRWRIRLP